MATEAERPPRPAVWWLLVLGALLGALGLAAVLLVPDRGEAQPSGSGTGSASSATTPVIGDGQGTAGAQQGAPKPFAISGTVDGLYPGASQPLVLTFTNPNDTAIRVTDLSVTVAAASPDCPGSLLSFSTLAPLGVPAKGTASGQVDTRMSESASELCQGVRWQLTYSGTAVQA